MIGYLPQAFTTGNGMSWRTRLVKYLKTDSGDATGSSMFYQWRRNQHVFLVTSSN